MMRWSGILHSSMCNSPSCSFSLQLSLSPPACYSGKSSYISILYFRLVLMAIFCILCHPPSIAFLQSHLLYLPRVTYNTIVSKKPLSWLSFPNYHCVLILFLIVYYPIVHWLSYSVSYMFTCLLYLGFESLNFIILQYCSATEEIGHICWLTLVLLCNGEQLWEAYLILYSV